MFRNASAFGSFSVDDIDSARNFYEKKLGLEVSETEGALELHHANGRTLVYPKDDHRPATYTVLNFPVDDIAGAYDELTRRGVRFGYQNDAELQTDDRGIYWGEQKGQGPNIAWFTDPAGNILSIVQDK